MDKKVISQEDIMKLLDGCYEKCLNGIPYVSPKVEELADDYRKKAKSKEDACKAMINNQIIKENCGTGLLCKRFQQHSLSAYL